MARKSATALVEAVPTVEVVQLVADAIELHARTCLNWEGRPMHLRTQAEKVALDLVENLRPTDADEQDRLFSDLARYNESMSRLQKEHGEAARAEEKAWAKYQPRDPNVKHSSYRVWKDAEDHYHAVAKQLLGVIDAVRATQQRLTRIGVVDVMVPITEAEFGEPPLCDDCREGDDDD